MNIPLSDPTVRGKPSDQGFPTCYEKDELLPRCIQNCEKANLVWSAMTHIYNNVILLNRLRYFRRSTSCLSSIQQPQYYKQEFIMIVRFISWSFAPGLYPRNYLDFRQRLTQYVGFCIVGDVDFRDHAVFLRACWGWNMITGPPMHGQANHHGTLVRESLWFGRPNFTNMVALTFG